MADHSIYSRIYAMVNRIPRGKVATYGQIAALAGVPGHARQVGYALHSLPRGSGVPWQRVINREGRVSQRSDPAASCLQRAMLEDEGVVFDAADTISMKKYQWRRQRGD